MPSRIVADREHIFIRLRDRDDNGETTIDSSSDWNQELVVGNVVVADRRESSQLS